MQPQPAADLPQPSGHALTPDPATVAGSAGRVSAADKAAVALQAAPAVLRATLHITRASGAVETVEIVGTPVPNTTA